MVMKMEEKILISNSVEETMNIAEKFMDEITTGTVISLIGDIGAGKTAFTKGIGRSLEIEDTISSPTFTLIKEYEGRLKLNHIDAYRLENASSDPLALYDLMEDDAVVVIEWSNFIEGLEPDYQIEIEYIDDNSRKITFKGEQI
ncbi:MAG: tRNA (adenosine(37)-N6)-threonylcarbamoyltransferase complex ATPase subunit type 1 TsaE [Erysipelothrix sp.]|nr:tRNA (adenosine(37)-N6)-threonylcarbamoyltransferase complex ATPase subunit type 1 TsaE [Erysipelothrix sp.]